MCLTNCQVISCIPKKKKTKNPINTMVQNWAQNHEPEGNVMQQFASAAEDWDDCSFLTERQEVLVREITLDFYDSVFCDGH